MPRSDSTIADEHIVDAMILLARAATADRVIVAGSNPDLFRPLHRRGYLRVASTKTCLVPCGQYQVALLAWREPSTEALEVTLAWLARFLNTTGVLVVWVGGEPGTVSRNLRLVMQKLGLWIESGTCCEHGFVVSARRREPRLAAQAA